LVCIFVLIKQCVPISDTLIVLQNFISVKASAVLGKGVFDYGSVIFVDILEAVVAEISDQIQPSLTSMDSLCVHLCVLSAWLWQLHRCFIVYCSGVGRNDVSQHRYHSSNIQSNCRTSSEVECLVKLNNHVSVIVHFFIINFNFIVKNKRILWICKLVGRRLGAPAHELLVLSPGCFITAYNINIFSATKSSER
jgi:hypothetical protein